MKKVNIVLLKIKNIMTNTDKLITKHYLEDSTIQKYKEENGLLTQKQQQVLAEKRRIEQETQQLKSQLEQEKNKQPKVEIKEVIKEKVIGFEVLRKSKKNILRIFSVPSTLYNTYNAHFRETR